jgi:hypothetical protein
VCGDRNRLVNVERMVIQRRTYTDHLRAHEHPD